jgi:aminopeptidase N
MQTVKLAAGVAWVLAAVGGLWLAGMAAARQEGLPAIPTDPRIEAETGRQRAVWAVAARFDHLSMSLEMVVPSMNEPKARVRQVLQLTPRGQARTTIELDAGPGITITSMTARVGAMPVAVEHRREGRELVITLARTAQVGEAVVLTTDYDLDMSANRGDGLTWSRPNPEGETESDKAPQIHAQGQPESNHLWFPCHDFPNERLTTEITVDVEDGFEVCSNGYLASRGPSGPGRTRWHWVQDKTHVSYLVTLVIGKLAIVDLGENGVPYDLSSRRAAGGDLPIVVYVPIGTEERAKKVFGNTPEMITFFERAFDEPYPWDKYAQLVVRDFTAGGMENTSATILYRQAVSGRDQDDLIAHELGHQWFGDLITCRSWEHLWLNEGWASYCEALWREEQAGKDNGDAAYQRSVLGFLRRQRAQNRGSAPQSAAMVSNRYKTPNGVFMKADDVYSKGALVLHMLRERLGRETFMRGIQLYIDRFKFGNADTDDFRRTLEEVSGQSLERFFDQWTRRPGLPRLDIELAWDESAKSLEVSLKQTQKIDLDNPAYAFSLPLYCAMEDGSGRWIDVDMSTRELTKSFSLPAKPKSVEVDPNLTVFAATSVSKPLAMWRSEAQSGSTLIARAQAAAALARLGEDGIVAAASDRFDDLFDARASDVPAVLRTARGDRPRRSKPKTPRRTRRRSRPAAIGVVALLLTAGVAQAAATKEHECASCAAMRLMGAPQGGVYDEATGRSLLNYPPHRVVDYRHMKLELTVRDMNTPVIEATQTLSFSPLGSAVGSIELDARGLRIASVRQGATELKFSHDGLRLRIEFASPVELGTTAEIVTSYEIQDPMYGLMWTPESPAWPGRPAQIHTQGQTETNSYWFPCHDFPNDKVTTEVLATVPRGYEVLSNGRLLGRAGAIIGDSASDAIGAYETFHWLQDKPHVNYLVTMVIGKFDVVDVGSAALPMPVYAPLGRGSDVQGTYGRTARMLSTFERLLNEPYPWDKYAQAVVWNFGWGGMENTSATTMYDTAIIERSALLDNDLDGLISHELAHQWFGDLLTCNSWEHIWLNEGFATWMTGLWTEERDGKDAYDLYARGVFDGVIGADRGSLPETPAMASKVYSASWETFQRAANPYGKGAAILHMLRRKLGDDVMFRGLSVYIDRNRFQTVETGDLRKALEDTSGESLEQFFAQWVTRPNVPRVNVTTAWDPATSEFKVDLVQTQKIDGANPAFEFTFPVWVSSDPSGGDWLNINVTGRTASGSIRLPAEPRMVAFDPKLTVIAEVNASEPVARSMAIAAQGPTPAARIQGIRALHSDKSESAAAVLAKVAIDTREHPAIRAEAVRALARRNDYREVQAMLTMPIDDWRVREAMADAAADLASPDRQPTRNFREEVFQHLSRRAERDPSVKVRAASIRGLGAMRATGAAQKLVTWLDVPSQDDQIRSAAIDAIAALDRRSGLPTVMSMTGPSVHSRTRADAVRAMGRLSHHDPDATFARLAELLDDRQMRVRNAAGAVLAGSEDPKGRAVLEAALRNATDEGWRRQLEGWLRK